MSHWFSIFSYSFHRRLHLDQDHPASNQDQPQDLDQELDLDINLDPEPDLPDLDPDQYLDTGTAVFRIFFIDCSKTNTQTNTQTSTQTQTKTPTHKTYTHAHP